MFDAFNNLNKPAKQLAHFANMFVPWRSMGLKTTFATVLMIGKTGGSQTRVTSLNSTLL